MLECEKHEGKRSNIELKIERERKEMKKGKRERDTGKRMKRERERHELNITVLWRREVVCLSTFITLIKKTSTSVTGRRASSSFFLS